MPLIFLIFGFMTAMFNDGFVDLHFSSIHNPILFYVSGISTTIALLLIGEKIHPKCVTWCGKESLLLMLAQTGMIYICEIITKFINIAELPYAVILIISVAVLVFSLLISYFVIKFIHSTFLKILIIPPKKREVK